MNLSSKSLDTRSGRIHGWDLEEPPRTCIDHGRVSKETPKVLGSAHAGAMATDEPRSSRPSSLLVDGTYDSLSAEIGTLAAAETELVIAAGMDSVSPTESYAASQVQQPPAYRGRFSARWSPNQPNHY